MILVITLFLYWVYGNRPLVGDVWQWADDGLYLRQAEAILKWLHGEGQPWLGPYDPVVLGKAPLFAIWLVVLHILHFPIRISEFAVLVALPWFFRIALRPLRILSLWPLAAVTVLLTALPFLPLEQRLLRTASQAALTSACQISAMGLVLRARRRDIAVTPWAASTGLLFALAYLNREEAIWLLPVMFSCLAAVLNAGWQNRSWRRTITATVCLVVATALPLTIISALNYHYYGVFVTTARRAPEFTRAHQLMTSLEPATHARYVPITEVTRLKAYAVSPTFARLRDYLEGPQGDRFAKSDGHLIANGWPTTKREFFVSNFQFVLQEAAFQAGAHSAQDSEVLFGAIANELEAAIAQGKISSGSKGPATLSAPFPGDVRLIAAQTVVSITELYTLRGMTFPGTGFSTDTPEDRVRLETMTSTAVTPPNEMRVSLPELGRSKRILAYDVINRLEIFMNVVGTAALVLFIATTAVNHRHNMDRLDQSFVGLMLGASLLAFSVGIAVVDVLGFPVLIWSPPAYNLLGQAPLSVLNAFGVVVLFNWVRPVTQLSGREESCDRSSDAVSSAST